MCKWRSIGIVKERIKSRAAILLVVNKTDKKGNIFMPIAITAQNYDQEVSQSSVPVIIDIYATWCGPCKQMALIIEELEKEVGTQYKFVKLNVDEARELAIKFGVSAIPTFVFIKNNEVLAKETGYIPKADFVNKIKKIFG